MSYSVKLEKLAKERAESRNIVKQILDFGVNENQKLDIIYELALNLNSNQAMKDIVDTLKKFRETINKDEEASDNEDKPKLII